METAEKPVDKVWTYCLWIAVAVILFVFVVPIESRTSGPVTISYTLWDKLTDSGPRQGEIRLSH